MVKNLRAKKRRQGLRPLTPYNRNGSGLPPLECRISFSPSKNRVRLITLGSIWEIKIMKEIIDALTARLKSPVCGYFFFAFVAINWKPIFYLFASSTEASERIAHFESSAGWPTLFIFPAVAACIFAAINPWVNFGFAWLIQKPTHLKNALQAVSEHKLLVEKMKLEKLRNRLAEAEERKIIDRAKRDQELNAIEDEGLRLRAKRDIELRRNKFSDISINEIKYALGHPYLLEGIEKEHPNHILKAASQTQRVYKSIPEDLRAFLQQQGYIDKNSTLTDKGCDLLRGKHTPWGRPDGVT